MAKKKITPKVTKVTPKVTTVTSPEKQETPKISIAVFDENLIRFMENMNEVQLLKHQALSSAKAGINRSGIIYEKFHKKLKKLNESLQELAKFELE